MRNLAWTGAAATLAFLAACSTDGTGPDLTPAADLVMARDVAIQAGEAASDDVEMMGGPVGLFGFGLAAGAADDGPFHCGTHEREHVTVVRTCTFKDAAGGTQTAFDPLTTESASIHAEINGEIVRDDWSATINRTRDLTVSGLAGIETSRTWNGTGTSSVTRARHGGDGTRSYDVSSTGSIVNVVVELPRTENRWPVSGTITRQVTVSITGGPRDGESHQRTVTITFNGTQFVPIQVNDRTFTFDLRARRIVRDGA